MAQKLVTSQAECSKCGGLHFGSVGCPYETTICDVCHQTLLQHPERCFCEGGKTEHDPRNNFCTCANCVALRMAEPAAQPGSARARRNSDYFMYGMWPITSGTMPSLRRC
jgi:hypothetical protein